VKLAARETEFVEKQSDFNYRWVLISLSVIIVAALIATLASFNSSSVVLNDTNSIVPSSTAEMGKNIESKKMANTSLMLVKEARESTGQFPNKGSIKAEAFSPKPAPAELEVTQWQSTEQNVFFYPESVSESVATAQKEEKASLGTRGLLVVNGHSEEEAELINQLAILPSETAINPKTVAGELTCELCSTIIYRPLNDDKNL
jgi:hypothetical protein